MDMPRDGRPLKFDGSNYTYWKTLMWAYIRAICERIWLSVVNGYNDPILTVNDVIIPNLFNNGTNWILKRKTGMIKH